jgi:hypothetical protein
MPEPMLSDLVPHDAAEELLPWYATGQLDPDEHARVERHLSSCAHCRRQLAFERRMVDEFAALSPEIDAGWARLKQRIERAEPLRPNAVARPAERWRDRVASAASPIWQTVSRPRIAAFAMAQLAFVIIAGAILLSLSRPSYRALGSAPAPQSANVIAIFRADTTESQLRELLQENRASLVGGPTPTDAYLLSVPGPSRQAALQRLRADRHVVMAQPIDAARS